MENENRYKCFHMPENDHTEHGMPEHNRMENGTSEHGRMENGTPEHGRTEYGMPEHDRMENGRTGYYSSPYDSGEYRFDRNEPYRDTRQNQEPKSGFAIASLVLGILALILFCSFINIPLAILSIVFGAIALGRRTRKGMAIAGLVTSIISIVLLIVLWGTVGSVMTQMLTPGTEWNEIYEGIQDGTYDYDDVYDDIYNDIYNDIYDHHDGYNPHDSYNYHEDDLNDVNYVQDGAFGDI